MQRKYRILSGVGAVLFAGTAIVTSSAISGAVGTRRVSDIVNFSGKAFLAVAPTATEPGSGSLVAKTCSLASDGERLLYPCTLTGMATLTRTGGTLTGTIKSRDSIIQFQESFVNTSPTTGVGTGTVTEFDFDDHCTTKGTFTASFTTSPTQVANILNEQGNIVVTDNAEQPCDTDNTVPTTMPNTTIPTGTAATTAGG